MCMLIVIVDNRYIMLLFFNNFVILNFKCAYPCYIAMSQVRMDKRKIYVFQVFSIKNIGILKRTTTFFCILFSTILVRLLFWYKTIPRDIIEKTLAISILLNFRNGNFNGMLARRHALSKIIYLFFFALRDSLLVLIH